MKKRLLQESLFNGLMIQDIQFTAREIDVIACIMNGRTSRKAIANTLHIHPTTVATHTQNILQKLHGSSWEHIRDFIEKSGKRKDMQSHFKQILIQEKFQIVLNELKYQLTTTTHVYQITYLSSESKVILPIVTQLEDIFKYLGLSFIPSSFIDQVSPAKPNLRKIFISYQDQKTNFNPSNYVSVKLFMFVVLEHLLNNDCVTKARTTLEEYIHLIYESPIYLSSMQSTWMLTYLNSIFKPYIQKIQTVPAVLFLCLTAMSLSGVWWLSKTTHISLKSDFVLPIPNLFLPRTKIIKEINERFIQSSERIRCISLVGMRGTGKTSLARWIGKHHKGHLAWELNAHSTAALQTSFKELADALADRHHTTTTLKEILSLPAGNEKERKLLIFVKSMLQKTPDWLLIYDNVENISEIYDYIPQETTAWGYGHVLITTCNANLKTSDLINPKDIILISELTHEEALTLFINIVYPDKKLSEDERQETQKFLANIPKFPLDIYIAGKYILNHQLTYEDYLERMKEQNFYTLQENLLNETHLHGYSRHYLMTISLQKILESNPEFSDLLLMLCCVDAYQVPRMFLESYKSPLLVDTFILKMKKYSLLNDEAFKGNISMISISTLTQQISLQYLRRHINPDDLLQKKIQILTSLERIVCKSFEEENIDHIKLLEPHLNRLLSLYYPESYHTIIEHLLGCLYYYLGEDLKSLDYLSRSLDPLKRLSKTNQLRIARTLSYLGDAYKNKGIYDQAIQCLEESVRLYATYHKDSLGHARTLTYLGNTYRMTGLYAKGKKVLKESLNIYQQYPDRREESSQPLGVLGTLYRDTGFYKDAIQTMDTSLQYFHSESTYLIWRIGISLCLGSAYTAAGESEKAKIILLDCYRTLKHLFSDDHALYPWVLIYLGDAYRNIGDLKSATLYLQESIETFQSKFSKDHAGYTIALSRLGALYLDSHKFEAAKNTLQDCIHRMEHIFGSCHIQLGYPLNELGKLYLAEQTYEDAEKILNQSLACYQRSNHTDMYRPLETLGQLYYHQSKAARLNQDTTLSIKQLNQAKIYIRKALNLVQDRLPLTSNHLKRLNGLLKTFENSK